MSDAKKKLDAIIQELGIDESSSGNSDSDVVIGLLKRSLAISKENNDMLRELLEQKPYRPSNRNYYSGWKRNDRRW